jgi:hypothetical protein
MAFVEEPAEPVHHPAMRDIGDALHRGDGGDKQGEAGEQGHAADIATMIAERDSRTSFIGGSASPVLSAHP